MMDRTGSWKGRGAGVLALLLVLTMGITAWRLNAQDAVPPGYRTYPLRHAQAAEIAPELRSVLAGVPGNPQLIIDKQSNALLVHGSEDAQRLAAQLLTTLDRPRAPAVEAAKQEPVVRGYRLSEAEGERTLAELKGRFPAETGTNLSFDRRTGQLLAVAPPDVQRQIAQYLGVAAAPAERPPTAEPAVRQPRPDMAHAAAGPEVVQRGYPLKNINWQDFEQLLSRVWGRKSRFETNAEGDVASIRLQNAAGQRTAAYVDRRHNEVSFEGPRGIATHWARLISVLDSPPTRRGEAMQIVPVHEADPEQLHDAIELIKASLRDQPRLASGPQAARSVPVTNGAPRRPRHVDMLVARVFQQPEEQPPPAEEAPAEEGEADEETLAGPVQIEFLEGLDVIILRGRKADVDRVARIIADIERLSQETEPVIELYMLRHVDSNAVGDLVIQIYNQVLAARQGRVSITPLDKPNALLLIGRRDSIDAVLDLVKKLDQPITPQTQFQVFQLRHMPAAEGERILEEFFSERGTLGTVVRVSVDPRTNAVIVHASPRDLAEAAQLLVNVDRPDSAVQSELRVFNLKNTLATELAPILQQAITGATGPTAAGAALQPAGQAAPTPTGQAQLPPGGLTFMTVDSEGGRLLESGLLTDVRITADPNANAILVRGPPRSMDLIAALVKELDRLPDSEAQIKVFTIINGDATNLAVMLQQLFGQAAAGGAFGAGQAGAFGQLITAGGESSLVPLRFAVDTRTNSVIVSGSPGDLNVVEAILLRLDEGDIRERRTTVYRLRNAPAVDVATAITQFLTSERQVQLLAPTATSPFEQLEREVVVVPEPVSNSLIISATPRFYDEIIRVVEELDARPPMVMIQVLIAEVELDDFEEFGAEFGLQDSLLFDRSVIGGAVAAPGYAFNNNPPANVGSNPALSGPLAGQSLTHFALGRTNGNLGYGGLVLSASNESISILIRALQDAQRLQVLSRPQVMTLDNQSAFVQVGQRVPRITATTSNQVGITNSVQLDNVGLLLGVTPRISPDGLVVMEIDAEKSELGPIDQGIPISFGPAGEVIRQPIINTTLAQTTVSARSGQTVILGGLITKTRGYSSRRVPYLSDIPILGRLFRYDAANEERTELLIIMTPHIVNNESDAEWIKQVESNRMSWCLADVVEMHGPAGLSAGYGLWGPPDAPTIYPDLDPTGRGHCQDTPVGGELPPGMLVPQPLHPPLPAGEPTPADVVPSDQSSRRRLNLQPPLRPAAKSTNEQAWSPAPVQRSSTQPPALRTEHYENATVYYAEPPQRATSYGPLPGELSPAVYQQTQPWPGR